MKIAIDVCVSWRCELELWRAGFEIPVRAGHGEPDESWLARAVEAGCWLVVSMDKGACRRANELGMRAVRIRCVEGPTMERVLTGIEYAIALPGLMTVRQ